MIVAAIKPYSYNIFGIKNNQVQNSSTHTDTIKRSVPFDKFNYIAFNGNNHNWTEGKLSGYNEQLKYLQNILITPIKDKNAVSAPIVIVYSPDKDVTNLVKQSVNDALVSSVNRINANNNESFKTILNNGFTHGRNHYKTTGKKTILMIDNIEKYISTSEKEMARLKKDFGEVFNDKNIEKIKKYGNNLENINILKSSADYCSGLPKRENDISSATTIFSVSETPQIIDSELLRRPEKVYTIVFPPLYGEAFAKILKDEVLKQDKFVQNIKYLTDKEIEKIEMPYNSWQNLQKIKKNSDKNPLNLNTAKIPFDIIAEFCSPDDKYGAFLTKQIPEIVQQAVYKYIEAPEKEFLPYLLKELKNTKRLLTPQDLEYENKIKNFVEYREDSNYFKDIKQVDKTLKAYIAGLITSKKISKLVADIVNAEIESVKNNSIKEDIFAGLKYKSVLDKLKTKYILSRIDKLSENRYKFSFQNGKTDYVDLYLGSFGWGKETLWVDSTNMKKVELTRHFINEIKSLDEFKDVKTIEFPVIEKPKNAIYKPTGRVTIDKKPIYYVNLEISNSSE